MAWGPEKPVTYGALLCARLHNALTKRDYRRRACSMCAGPVAHSIYPKKKGLATTKSGQDLNLCPCLHTGMPIAVKRARISTSRDLDSFRTEVMLLARLAHPSIITLIGAHLLPPGDHPLATLVIVHALYLIVLGGRTGHETVIL
jgi:hypothetical protein